MEASKCKLHSTMMESAQPFFFFDDASLSLFSLFFEPGGLPLGFLTLGVTCAFSFSSPPVAADSEMTESSAVLVSMGDSSALSSLESSSLASFSSAAAGDFWGVSSSSDGVLLFFLAVYYKSMHLK